MPNTEMYIRQNVQVEPLFNQWYAWSHLISPATAAMNIANSHLKIMKSYVAAPQIHASAVQNPALLGGPFIDYNGGRVDEIKALIERTTRERSHMLSFAEAVRHLDNLLRAEAKGYSLESLYPRVPEILKGFVELVYDLNNNPSIRFVEGLLYHSEFYDTSSQALLLSLIDQDYRPFALSTPRLPDDKSLQLNIPFKDGSIDELFEMNLTPKPFDYIKERLGLSSEDEVLFRSLLTEEKPRIENGQCCFKGEGIRLRYFGHACMLLQTQDVSILIDPAVSYDYDNGIERYTYLDLPAKIDYVLITHGHQDHIMFESLLQLRHKISNMIVPRNGGGSLQDPSLKLVLEAIGFKNVIEIDEMETIDIPGGSITGLPFFGEHTDLSIRTKIAHLIRLKDKSFLFAADSNNIEPKLYERIFKALGDIDVLFIGMECDGAPMSWLYGPLLTQPIERKMDQSRRLSGSDFERGVKIVEQLNCREVYVYAMGQEPWLNYVMSIKYTEESRPIVASNQLIESCLGRGIAAKRLFCKEELFY